MRSDKRAKGFGNEDRNAKFARMTSMKRRLNMCDFVRSGCESAKESENFLDDWFKTKRNPCSICGKDKSKCSFYKELVDKGVIDEKENPP